MELAAGLWADPSQSFPFAIDCILRAQDDKIYVLLIVEHCIIELRLVTKFLRGVSLSDRL